jgi:pyruvyltransferase
MPQPELNSDLLPRANRPTQIARGARVVGRALTSRVASVGHESVKTYWAAGVVRGFMNFGDQLGPWLLRQYGVRPLLTTRSRAEYLLVGSLLHRTPEDFAGVIAGPGLIEPVRRSFPRASIRGVRGPLTAHLIDAPADAVLGDPGLLVGVLRAPRPYATNGPIGVIPHYLDKGSPAVASIAHRLGHEVRVIDVQAAVDDVLDAVAGCRVVLSSSLHGLVVAEGLGVPRGWVGLESTPKGDGFKFRDHAGAIGETLPRHMLAGTESFEELAGLGQEPGAGVGVRAAELHESMLDLFAVDNHLPDEGAR